MAGRLTRFLNLEKRRGASDAPAHEVVTKARFSGETPREAVLDLDDGRQPFIRCPACEADNNRGAGHCFNCQQPLQTDAVRAWNAAYWTKRQHDEAAPPVSRPPAPPVPAALPSDEQVAAALASDLGERAQMKLFGYWRLQDYDPTPIGFRILGAIQDAWTRLIVGLFVLAAFFGSVSLAFKAPPRSPWRFVGFGVGVLLLILFTPSTPRRRRWWF